MLKPLTDNVEQLTQTYGQEIFARLDQPVPLLFSPGWFDERLMEWTMHHEVVKTQLFRFIDVLPLLHDPVEVSRHLREYFAEAGDHLPNWARLGMRWVPHKGNLAFLMARMARSSARRLARKFIAGSNIKEVLKAISRMRNQSLGFSVDLLGEATISEAEANHYQQAYLDLVQGLTAQVNRWPENQLVDDDDLGTFPRVNVSVKLTSLYSQFDALDAEGTSVAVRNRLRPIFRAARRRNAFINIDMEQYAYKDLTIRIFREILEEDEFRDWPHVGIAIQAYLRDSEKDLAELAQWVEDRGTPVWVRLIKGAYWDYETVIAAQENWETPVYTVKADTDAVYEKLTRFLLENHTLLRPAFGSHNVRSLAHALALAKHLRVSKRNYEFQVLYGMGDPFAHALVSLGQRVRVYTPYGELLPGMAYLVRRLLENTANTSFIRASLTEHVPEGQLLMNPLLKSEPADGKPETKTPDVFCNEPLTDFTKEDNRKAMQTALAEVEKQFGQTYPLVIGGKEVTNSETIDSANPADRHQIVGKCSKATTQNSEEAIQAAKEAFPAWRDLSAVDRCNYLKQTAEKMRNRRHQLAAWQVFECGKQWREADADVAEAIDFCEYYAREMERLASPKRVDVPGEENENFYQPRGVTVVIAPWNFPLAILTGMTAAALVTGNTVVMKPAEQSSVIAAKLMEIFQEIGLPSGVANYLPGIGEEIGPALVNHKDVAMIAFTGSRTVGLLINKQAADQENYQSHVKKVLAEMGGKNAIIIDNDADLDEAVEGVVASAFGYQGQKCSACSRAIVLEGLHDEFLQRLVEATRSLKMAPANDPGSFVGPVINEEARNRILDYIGKGKAEANLVFAGEDEQLSQKGHFVGPHIFANVDPDDTIAQEEIFGPVLAVIKAKNLDEALDIANGTSYALTGGIYSRSPANIQRVKQEFRVGNLYINRKITGALVGRQPFGGFKLSGIGTKAGGSDYLLQFMIPRTITENTMRRGFAPQ